MSYAHGSSVAPRMKEPASTLTSSGPAGARVGRRLGTHGVLARPGLERLEHRLLVLELVLEDEPVDEALAEQRVGRVEVDVVEDVERSLAHVLGIRPRGRGPKRRQRAVLAARVPERLLHLLVHVGVRPAAVQALEEPELLEAGDLREVPDERGDERRRLLDELVVGERLEELGGCRAGPLERGSDLDPGVHARTMPYEPRLVHAPSVAFPGR